MSSCQMALSSLALLRILDVLKSMSCPQRRAQRVHCVELCCMTTSFWRLHPLTLSILLHLLTSVRQVVTVIGPAQVPVYCTTQNPLKAIWSNVALTDELLFQGALVAAAGMYIRVLMCDFGQAEYMGRCRLVIRKLLYGFKHSEVQIWLT